MEMLDGFVRTVRSIRPDLVLIGVGRRAQLSARAAHQIKTDGVQPPLVGLMDWDGRISDAVSVAKDSLVDGIFVGTPTPDALRDFLLALRGDDAVVMGEAPRRGWKRLLGR